MVSAIAQSVGRKQPEKRRLPLVWGNECGRCTLYIYTYIIKFILDINY
ncbi:hypothetical protein NUACC26_008930 [Scytonema sp. NUACC26]